MQYLIDDPHQRVLNLMSAHNIHFWFNKESNGLLLLDNAMLTTVPFFISCSFHNPFEKAFEIFDLCDDKNWKNNFFLLPNKENLISNLHKESNALALQDYLLANSHN